MSDRELLAAWESLPPQARRQVAAFIAALEKQHELVRHPPRRDGADLSHEPFVGMWRDRHDLKDSSAWVRKTRQTEWSDA